MPDRRATCGSSRSANKETSVTDPRVPISKAILLAVCPSVLSILSKVCRTRKHVGQLGSSRGDTGVLGEDPLPEPDQRDRLRPRPAPEQALGRNVGHRLRRVGHVDVHIPCGSSNRALMQHVPANCDEVVQTETQARIAICYQTCLASNLERVPALTHDDWLVAARLLGGPEETSSQT